MKRFQCPGCSNELHFDNTRCVSCGTEVAYLPTAETMLALTKDNLGAARATHAGGVYKSCANSAHHVCNWLVEADDAAGLCKACRHNRQIPDLSVAENTKHWQAMELAKRQLFYSLIKWGVPLQTAAETPNGLTFDFLADSTAPDGSTVKVMTGHQDGLITLNIAEADDATREKIRTSMRESYRTLLGHFRHEIGHYYWDKLVRDGGKLDAFRATFGDETADYGAALQRHYEQGPPADWPQRFISQYAAAHPWEDFAETWAHYIHIIDSLETARAYGMSVSPTPAAGNEVEVDFRPYSVSDIEKVLEAWVPFTVALNSINRSMGQRDFYPFVMSAPVVEKLRFVHKLVQRQPLG